MMRVGLVVLFCLLTLRISAQITASTPNPTEAPAAKSSYFPADELNFVDSLANVEQGLPTALMIDPQIVQKRLAGLQQRIPLNYNLQTHQFVEYFAFKKAEFTQRMLEKRDTYFPIYEKYLKQYNLPEELKYLSLIESGLEPKALSNKGAGGLWQFMPYTARGDFGMRVDSFVDERFDVEKATEAACKYLGQLYRIFGDWHLALAAYNTGPGNVKRAIRKCGKSDFWGIYNCLPKQTRAYVPQFIAMNYMMNYNWDHAIHAEKYHQVIPSDTVHVKGYLNLALMNRLATISNDTFRVLNPHVLSAILPADVRKIILRIPKDKLAYFQANRSAILDSASYVGVKDSLAVQYVDRLVKKTIKVKRGQDIYDIARIIDVSVFELKRLNHLRSNRLKKGKRIVYYTRVREKVNLAVGGISAEVDSVKVVERKPTGKKHIKYYKVRSGDTLSEIADRHHGLSVEKIRKLNHLRSKVILRPGMRLRIS
jgi:membrane-bound lytic murein transglycosylase D